MEATAICAKRRLRRACRPTPIREAKSGLNTFTGSMIQGLPSAVWGTRCVTLEHVDDSFARFHGARRNNPAAAPSSGDVAAEQAAPRLARPGESTAEIPPQEPPA